MQRDTFKYVVGDLNRLIEDIEFILIEEFGDITYYFGPTETWNSYIEDCNPEAGRTSYSYSYRGYSIVDGFYCGVNESDYTNFSISESNAQECAIL